jgi:ribosomal-protein-alanine N-acetyltransferase
MSIAIAYSVNKASVSEITEHLLYCDADFVPTLSARVEISDYAQKIANKAMRFEAWSSGTLVALVAAYCNDQETHIAHITSVSVLKALTGQGIASNLLQQCIGNAKAAGMLHIGLEVTSTNVSAIKLYAKNGFVADKLNEPTTSMTQNLTLRKP